MEYEYECQVNPPARFLRLSSDTCPHQTRRRRSKVATAQFKICQAHQKRLIVLKEMMRSAG